MKSEIIVYSFSSLEVVDRDDRIEFTSIFLNKFQTLIAEL